MDAMKLSIRLWGILFHSSRSAISKSRTVAGGLGRAAMSSEHVPNMLDWIQVREHAGNSIRCIVSASSMFSTIRALCGRALSSWECQWLQRDDMRSKYRPRPVKVPFDMQSAYADSTPYHPTSSSVL
ncbi:hypothetical protein TNCV_2473761 [Trichonephila clavipes]|nr:hypothetical protein TNCV_2473761 [Trichonephila clavipes]